MDFPNNEVNKLVVGSEECEAYLAQRHGGKSGVSLSFAGHKGTISGISLNKTHGQPVRSVGVLIPIWKVVLILIREKVLIPIWEVVFSLIREVVLIPIREEVLIPF